MDIFNNYSMTIDGEQVTSPSTIAVTNPANGKPFASAPNCTEEQLNDAVVSAQRAFKTWSAKTISQRQALVHEVGEALKDHADDFAKLFTNEQGRPLALAKNEILRAATWLQEVAKITPPVQIIEDSPTQRVETHYVPLGVVCAISPWNFPVLLAIWKIAPALVAGNTVVLKPSPFTPLCVLKIGELFSKILPAGVLNIITGDDALGPLMTSHPGFAKISFTGSTAVGKSVLANAAKDLKRVTLELGGNDAAIILPDVDVDKIAEKIFFGAFYNSAQICIATKRLYIHEDIYEPLLSRLIELAKSTKVGDGSEPETILGPVQNERQYHRVSELIEDARRQGLTLFQGAEVPNNGGYFIPITLVDNPPETSRVVQEEAFGPILPLLKFKEIDEVIQRANASEYGLAGAVWSKDIDQALAIARRLETGTVWINQNLVMRADTQFAGHKQSGFGVENSLEGLLEYMVPQSIMIAKDIL